MSLNQIDMQRLQRKLFPLSNREKGVIRMSRRERRALAKKNGATFEPQYNGRVITKAEYDKEVEELKELRKKTEEAFKKSAEVEEVIEEDK